MYLLALDRAIRGPAQLEADLGHIVGRVLSHFPPPLAEPDGEEAHVPLHRGVGWLAYLNRALDRDWGGHKPNLSGRLDADTIGGSLARTLSPTSEGPARPRSVVIRTVGCDEAANVPSGWLK